MKDKYTKRMVVSTSETGSSNQIPELVSLIKEDGSPVYLPTESELSGQFAALIPPLFARKPINTARNTNTTFEDDPHLTLALEANTVVRWELVVFYDGPTAGDIKFVMTHPVGSSGRYGVVGALSSASSTSGQVRIDALTEASSSSGAVGTLAGTLMTFRASGLVVMGESAGNLTLRWAQSTSDAADTTVYANSWLLAHRVA